MTEFLDHPLRYPLANELHARPFPALSAPCRAAFLAVKRLDHASMRDREADRAHLIQLLDRFGADHPKPGATHWFGRIGRHSLKWENHTEFVTYTIFEDGVMGEPFDPRAFEVFPADWLASAPGRRITSALIRVEAVPDERIAAEVADWFVPESLALSRVLDGSAVVVGDFRIDAGGHMRFAVFPTPDCGQRRIGRIVQRLCEIETYKSMSMLGLARSREMGPSLREIDARLGELTTRMAGENSAPETTLKSLLAVSSEIERLAADAAFRFGATKAYAALVDQRIGVLREDRFGGRQTFAEFMMRRYDPSMRTVAATERQLQALSDRAIRAGDLLRTQVDVERSAQNQALLESMDRRSDLALRLQRTVEGLSVVAISYYAVNLAFYALWPLIEGTGLSKTGAMAVLTPLVVLFVWAVVRRIRKRLD